MTLAELFKKIADAIRSKNNTTGSITATQFPDEIEKIESGGAEFNIESIDNGDGTQTLSITHKDYEAPLSFETTFANNTPEQISKVSELITANNMTSAQVAENFGWHIGDTHDITLTSGETIQIRIIGVNHDTKSDGSGKAGLTLQLVNCLASNYRMNDTDTNAGGYPGSKMRSETLPTIKALLPQEWQNVIKFVDKKSANGGSTNYSETQTTSDDLFLLSTIEMFSSAASSQDGANEGSQYEYWQGKEATDRIKYYDANGDGVPETASYWWMRSVDPLSTSFFRGVNVSGNDTYYYANSSRGVAFGFCI